MKHILLSAGFIAVASAVSCDYAVVGPTLQSLGKPIASCMTATGNSYNLARASAPPTADQAAAICAKCPDFVAAVTALPPWPDCTMNVGGSDQTLTSYFDKMIGGCKSDASAKSTNNMTKETVQVESSGSAGKAPVNKTEDVTTAPVQPTAPVPSPTSGAVDVRVRAVVLSVVTAALAVVM